MKGSILETIGNTPLVEIKHLNPNPRVKILAKLEYLNPGGSIKDRAALHMIEAGEKSGQLTTGQSVIEATSGNTGIGLALVCAVKGYRLLLAMSESVSRERQKILRARGAEILLTPARLGTDGAIEKVYQLARENPDAFFMTDQFNNDANWNAHYVGTAEEIWRQTGGDVSTVVAAMGTTGTVMGISRRLKEYRSRIKIVGVEPYLGHRIQGLKNMKESYCPEIYDKRRLDKKVNIEDDEAFDMTRRLASEEGLFVGMSSGAAMAVARREADSMSGGTIVVICPDGGERYLSTQLFTVKHDINLQLFNTAGRKKEKFESLTPGKVSIYSCGPTAHTRAHLGVLRRYVFADLLCRYLEYSDYGVNHVMNITDMDDRTITGSEQAGMELGEFTEKYTDLFKQDLHSLGVKPPARYARASEHITEMLELAEKLAGRGYAYEKLRSLYFDISRMADYGKLSGIDLEKIKVGATVDLEDYEKDNPRDFTLLKRSRLSELKRGIFTRTRWGNVRPSWHLQCAAISMKYLGESFDIHTSSRELVFPHHENEMAIAAAVSGKPLAQYWLHCNQVVADTGPESKKAESPTMQDLDRLGYSGKEIRYWLLSQHYRKPVKFSTVGLTEARRSLKRLNTFIRTLLHLNNGKPYPELDQLIYDLKHGFSNALDDDLNIPAALVLIFKKIKQINVFIQQARLAPDDAIRLLDLFKHLDSVLNILDFDHRPSGEPEIEKLIRQRQEARRRQDWELADKIREQLIDRGVTVQDRKISRD